MHNMTNALESRSVLLVDDDCSYAEYLRESLSQLGAKLDVAGSYDEARQALLSKQFDLVITDLVLEPSGRVLGSSGVDVIQELRRVQPRALAFVVSGFAADYREVLSDLGVPVYDKGSDLPALAASIERSYARLGPQRTSGFEPIDKPVALNLDDIRRAFIEEAEKLVALKERTLVFPGEGQFELPKPLQGFKREIEKKVSLFPYEHNVFLMMKYRATNRDVADYIAETIKRRGLLVVRADDVQWNITNNVYNPIAVLYCCKYGLALFDEPEKGQTYSANVAYELGMMHLQNKRCMILRHSSLPQVPFDLIKDLYVSYDRDLQLKRIIDRWVDEITL